jgi:hypothetical protein
MWNPDYPEDFVISYTKSDSVSVSTKILITSCSEFTWLLGGFH